MTSTPFWLLWTKTSRPTRAWARWKAAITATTEPSHVDGPARRFPDFSIEADEVHDVGGNLTFAAGRARGHGAGSDTPIDRWSGRSPVGGAGSASWSGLLRHASRSPRSRRPVGVGDVAGERGDRPHGFFEHFTTPPESRSGTRLIPRSRSTTTASSTPAPIGTRRIPPVDRGLG